MYGKEISMKINHFEAPRNWLGLQKAINYNEKAMKINHFEAVWPPGASADPAGTPESKQLLMKNRLF